MEYQAFKRPAVSVSLRMKDSIYAQLKEISYREQKSMSLLINTLLQAGLDAREEAQQKAEGK